MEKVKAGYSEIISLKCQELQSDLKYTPMIIISKGQFKDRYF